MSANQSEFFAAYRAALVERIAVAPYDYDTTDVDVLLARVVNHICRSGIRSCIATTPTFRLACKKVGIKHTYAAMEAYLA